MKRLFALGIIFALTSCTMIDSGNQLQDSNRIPGSQHMELGTFSISLAVKDIAASLKEKGLTLTSEADETTTGPASLTLSDPDGNTILIDQHR